jgi:ribonucleoside-diphosphate reductase alpha chain
MATPCKFKEVKKRDGRIVPFDQGRITNAIFKAMQATGEGNLEKDPARVSDAVVREINKRFPQEHIPHVEEIQDIVEECLILMDFPKTAKAYILYRQKRAEIRERKKLVPERVRNLARESKKYFRNPLSEFIYYRTYSRWIEEEQRRETWIETVDRYINFMKENLGDKLTESEYNEIKMAILKQEVMPSMRLLWSAGKAARTNNATVYNCSYIAPTKIEDIAEIMFLSMSGCGVGFSVESEFTQQFPIIKRQTGKVLPTHVVEDSKEGWCNALIAGLKAWFSGFDIKFDFSKVRPAGARLKTMGGRASGPEPLKALLEFCRNKILSKQGKRLSNLDIHDIICKIGEVVVAGGVRRTAMISLSDLDDEEMRNAKQGQFYLFEPQRQMANNSAVYKTKPSAKEFLKEWLALAESGTGERGIFNRGGIIHQVPKRRLKSIEKDLDRMGTNPCGEIILKSKEFCNLTEVVARPQDTKESLLKKIEIATILGTYQSTFTNFTYLSKDWKKNCEEERLLGVSITGQWDCEVVREAEVLRALKERAIRVNEVFAKRLGINPSLAITCVKPSGTVSLLVDASSGMHPRYSKYYIRRVRISATDPLFLMLKDQKVPYYPEVGQQEGTATTYVLEFPMKAPEGVILTKDLSAIEQLEHWKKVKLNYTEHNPSVTIYIGRDEWIKVANWLYENWDILGGLSFLPKADEHVYRLAPYEEIDEEQYKFLVSKFPEIDFSQILLYEKEDETMGAKEYACVGNICEISTDEISKK